MQHPTSGGFSQIPHVLIQGYDGLDMQDRYAVIALASVCWEERFYPLSLRQIAKVTRIDHTALRSRAGKNPREGVLDRLKRYGLIDFLADKPTSEITGNPGRAQTYICICYAAIWAENARFSVEKRTVRIIPSVDVVNSISPHTVDTVNHTVDTVNHTVDGACSNAGHNTSNTINTENTQNTEREERVHIGATAPVPSVVEEDPIPFRPDFSLSQKPVESRPAKEQPAQKLPDAEKLTPKQEMAHKTRTAFEVLEATKKEATGDPKACYAWSKADEKRLADLIRDCQGTINQVTRHSLRQAWLELYNRPDGWWKAPGRITVKAFCANYAAAMDAVRSAQLLEEKRQSRQEGKKTNPLEALRRQQAQFQPERKVAAL